MKPEHIIFETVVGSRAYGTARADSDEDIKGVYIEPRNDLLTLREIPDQHSDERGDVAYYALRRFLSLALKANPNIIELLFMPAECIRKIHPCFENLLANRDLFITRQAYSSHVNYARAQIKKARGQNKWINNPQPEEPPSPVDFCWIIPAESTDALPYRPVPLSESDLRLDECHAAAVERTQHLYRIYHYGAQARGVLRGGKIVCEAIPIDEEISHCRGLLIYNENAYERACLDHQNYWMWRKNRNEQRWQRQETGQLDYDAKNIMHMFRLMLSAEHILETGQPLVRFEGEKLSFLKSILAGAYSYNSLIEQADALAERLDALHKQSDLPDQPDLKRAEDLLHTVTDEWEQHHA